MQMNKRTETKVLWKFPGSRERKKGAPEFYLDSQLQVGSIGHLWALMLDKTKISAHTAAYWRQGLVVLGSEQVRSSDEEETEPLLAAWQQASTPLLRKQMPNPSKQPSVQIAMEHPKNQC